MTKRRKRDIGEEVIGWAKDINVATQLAKEQLDYGAEALEALRVCEKLGKREKTGNSGRMRRKDVIA